MALAVFCVGALFGDGCPPGIGEVGGYGRVDFFQDRQLVVFQRGTVVALPAAGALAGGEVAGELFFDDVVAD